MWRRCGATPSCAATRASGAAPDSAQARGRVTGGEGGGHRCACLAAGRARGSVHLLACQRGTLRGVVEAREMRRRVRAVRAVAARERAQLVPELHIIGLGVLAALIEQHVTVHLDALRRAPHELLARRDLHDCQALVVLAPVLQEPLQHLERRALLRPLCVVHRKLLAHALHPARPALLLHEPLLLLHWTSSQTELVFGDLESSVRVPNLTLSLLRASVVLTRAEPGALARGMIAYTCSPPGATALHASPGVAAPYWSLQTQTPPLQASQRQRAVLCAARPAEERQRGTGGAQRPASAPARAATVAGSAKPRTPHAAELQEQLSDFYMRYSPARVDKVRTIAADFARRGGGAEEFEALNDELRQVSCADCSGIAALWLSSFLACTRMRCL